MNAFQKFYYMYLNICLVVLIFLRVLYVSWISRFICHEFEKKKKPLFLQVFFFFLTPHSLSFLAGTFKHMLEHLILPYRLLWCYFLLVGCLFPIFFVSLILNSLYSYFVTFTSFFVSP